MHKTVRHALAVAAGVGAVLAATAGVAYADSDSGGNSHHPNGTGSGLSGGPTQTHDDLIGTRVQGRQH